MNEVPEVVEVPDAIDIPVSKTKHEGQKTASQVSRLSNDTRYLEVSAESPTGPCKDANIGDCDSVARVNENIVGTLWS
jgi:hypothetical protein